MTGPELVHAAEQFSVWRWFTYDWNWVFVLLFGGVGLTIGGRK